MTEEVTIYRARIEAPPAIREWFEKINEYAAVVAYDGSALIEFEVGGESIPDEYALAITVGGLEDELNSIGYWYDTTTIPRPEKVTDD